MAAAERAGDRDPRKAMQRSPRSCTARGGRIDDPYHDLAGDSERGSGHFDESLEDESLEDESLEDVLVGGAFWRSSNVAVPALWNRKHPAIDGRSSYNTSH